MPRNSSRNAKRCDDVTCVCDDVTYVCDDVTYVYDDVTYVCDDVTLQRRRRLLRGMRKCQKRPIHICPCMHICILYVYVCIYIHIYRLLKRRKQ